MMKNRITAMVMITLGTTIIIIIIISATLTLVVAGNERLPIDLTVLVKNINKVMLEIM